ncbi:uncharacterized protein LOC129566997 [Sitodiplosis mosellana]|uniref:uncharacterized protein LOC129566997 n=1 Tax=Sitodiplosis mosellana TaxID=263140 RepID=UPI002444A28C|nr:uncharacterized protein LOC129566997 [Sitodiplosis mosellana]
MIFPTILVFCIVLAVGYGQVLGSPEYCTDLIPQSNVTVHKLFGTWFGVEVITHKDRVTGERPSSDCIYVVISGITYEMATARPPENSREIVTQFGKAPISNPMKDYRYLRLEWTELDEKVEYILRYNISRSGFWLSSAPHERDHFGDKPSYSDFSGIIQVIVETDNHLVLTFCETIPKRQLFSIILTRHSNSIPMDLIKSIHDKLRNRNLQNIAYRPVCAGVDLIHGSYFLAITIALVFAIQ